MSGFDLNNIWYQSQRSVSYRINVKISPSSHLGHVCVCVGGECEGERDHIRPDGAACKREKGCDCEWLRVTVSGSDSEWL